MYIIGACGVKPDINFKCQLCSSPGSVSGSCPSPLAATALFTCCVLFCAFMLLFQWYVRVSYACTVFVWIEAWVSILFQSSLTQPQFQPRFYKTLIWNKNIYTWTLSLKPILQFSEHSTLSLLYKCSLLQGILSHLPIPLPNSFSIEDPGDAVCLSLCLRPSLH